MSVVDQSVLRERAAIIRTIEGKTLCHLLLRNATAHGHDPALSFKVGDYWEFISWREYRRQVLEAAAGICSLGVNPKDYVAIMSTNRPEALVAYNAVVHAAATPTILYHTLASSQIAYAAQNCGARVAILQDGEFMGRWLEVMDQLPAVEHYVLMEDAAEFADHPGVLSWQELRRRGRQTLSQYNDRWQSVQPEDTATLIYTSGTTGPPKGVILTHRNCLYESEVLDRVTRLPDGLTNVSYLPLAHIAEQILSIYIPLQKVGHIYCCPDPTQAVNYVRQARPFLFFGVPRVWEKIRAAITSAIEATESPIRRQLAQQAVEAGLQLTRTQQQEREAPLILRARHAVLERLVLAKIRQNIGLDRCGFAASAAAPMPVDVAEFFGALGLPVHDAWGLTECTGLATINRPTAHKLGSVGQALLGVEVRVAEDGELLIRGPNTTPGYLNLPQATQELIDEEDWIRTGDVGEVDERGHYRIVDRKKELIITAGGKNISPALIENLLKQHPLVGQALAYGDGKPYVVALLVLDGEVVPGWAKQSGIETTAVAELARHPRVTAEIEQAVRSANEQLARVEQVKRFCILPTEWTAQSEELTPTLKLKRRVIHDKYRDEIEGLYR